MSNTLEKGLEKIQACLYLENVIYRELEPLFKKLREFIFRKIYIL